MVETGPHVQVCQGLLRGKKVLTERAKEYFSFQGVPYAKPPVGSLRFQPPVKPDCWSGFRDATKEGNIAPQLDNDCYVGDEDCLYLNVYTPQLPGTKSVMLPVMVWIHGGFFRTGSGSSSSYGPDFFVEEGVVVVTINYRLGVLGFLSTEDCIIPGNMGLKDQVMALHWIRENIAAFGGDPDNVTLFGNSSGSACVHMHVLSPRSQGLFQKAISQSGTSLACLAFSSAPQKTSFHLAEHLGLEKGANSEELLDFLLNIDAKTLTEVSFFFQEDRVRGKVSPFRPTVEIWSPKDEAFLCSNPETTLKCGNFINIPFMGGITTNEGSVFINDFTSTADSFSSIDRDFHIIMPPEVSLNKADEVRRFYLGNQDVSIDTLPHLIKAKADPIFVYPLLKTIKLLTRLSSAPVFLFYFEVDGQRNFFKEIFNATFLPGSCHGDEIGYLWTFPLMQSPKVEEGSLERRTINTLVRMWSNFAKTGNPTPYTDSVVPVMWPAYTTENPYFLRIGDELTVEKNLLKKRIDFWESIYE